MKRISVVLLACIFSEKLLRLTEDCLLSLENQYDELIFVDNASHMLKEKWRNMADVYIRNNKNLGFSLAYNQGFKLTTGDYICVVTNDTRIEKGKLKDLTSLADKGYVFPTFTNKDKPDWDGAFYMFSRKTMEKNGIYDPIMRNYFSDLDLFYRAKKKGLALTKTDKVVVFHHEEQTYRPLGTRDFVYDEDHRKFVKKHKIDPLVDYYNFI